MSKFSNFFKNIFGSKNENTKVSVKPFEVEVCEKCTPIKKTETVEVEVEVEKPKPILVKKPITKKVEQKNEDVIIEVKTEQPKPKNKKRSNKNKKQPPKL